MLHECVCIQHHRRQHSQSLLLWAPMAGLHGSIGVCQHSYRLCRLLSTHVVCRTPCVFIDGVTLVGSLPFFQSHVYSMQYCCSNILLMSDITEFLHAADRWTNPETVCNLGDWLRGRHGTCLPRSIAIHHASTGDHITVTLLILWYRLWYTADDS